MFNEDLASMTTGAAFNVLVGDAGTFVKALHQPPASLKLQRPARPTPPATNTLVNDLKTNNDPGAFVFATGNWNPGGKGGTYDASQPGVWYDTGPSPAEWSMFNEPRPPCPARPPSTC